METKLKFMDANLAASLLSKYGSPLFVYDGDHIKSQAQKLSQAAQGFHISYAMKANSNKSLLDILKKNKVECVDVVSPGEIYKALANGYAGHQILYTENFISEEEIDYALSANVIINIGAFDTLNRFKQKLSGKQIFIRVNPQLGAGQNYNVITGGPKSKFGIYASELDNVAQIASEHNIKIIGLHQHIGSNLKKYDQEVFLRTTQYIFKLLHKFPDATKVNIGGGLGIKYKSNEELLDVKDLYDQVKIYRDKYSTTLSREIELWIQPGRFLVGESGYLLCRITAKKRTPQKMFIGTDTGFNHLLRPALYGSFHNIINLTNPQARSEKVTVCGNICESTDNLGKDIQLGGEIGDILSIQNAGAYAFSMSSNYNQRPRPGQVLIENGNERVIRRRETFEDLAQKL